MKPKTKVQREVMSLVPKLTPISERQKRYAGKHLFSHVAYRNGSVVYCMTCGKRLSESEIQNHKCSSCDNQIEVIDSKTRKIRDAGYYAIVSKCRNYQVVRYFYVKRLCVRKSTANYEFHEVAQEWFNEKSYCIVSRLATPLSYNTIYSLWSDMEVRKKLYVAEQITYPKMNLIPILKRNIGCFVKEAATLKTTPVSTMFYNVMNEPHAETLLKAGQFNLLDAYREDHKFINDHWGTIKICIRNGYVVEDFALWKDTIRAMEFCGQDLLNRKNVCPDNLSQAHDLWVARKEKLEDRAEYERKKEDIKKYENQYHKAKKKWLGIVIVNGDMRISVLNSVKEIFEEGQAMHHCVYAMEYYKKKNSLIMSVTNSAGRVATVEYSLKSGKVLQCRGLCNKEPEDYDKIISTIECNRQLFKSA